VAQDTVVKIGSFLLFLYPQGSMMNIAHTVLSLYSTRLLSVLLLCFMPLLHAAEKINTKAATVVTQPTYSKNFQLLLFSTPGCTYCMTMRDQVIHPMIEAGQIQPEQFEEVMQYSDADWQYVRGAGYKQIRDWKSIYKTSLFPTLVIVDLQGNKIAENIVGMTSPEHYRLKLDALLKTIP
jgi:thioredoxin-related protein